MVQSKAEILFSFVDYDAQRTQQNRPPHAKKKCAGQKYQAFLRAEKTHTASNGVEGTTFEGIF